MKIFVTGGAGYVGTVLVPMLLQRYETVRVYDNLTFGADPIVPFFRHSNFEFVQGDIRDGETLKKSLQGMDAVIHLAAIVGYPACKRDPERAEQINVLGTRILNLCRNGQPVIYASTGSNYGAIPDGVCTEETPLNPLTVYGRTKTEAEQLLMDAGNAIGYRFATAFGLSPRLRLDLLVNDFTYQAVQNKNLVIYEGHFQRTFIHVQDMARAFIHALQHYDQMKNNIYNCGDNALNASKVEIAQKIQAHVPFYLHAAEIGQDADQRNYTVSYDKIQATGFHTSVSLDAGIAEMVRAFRFLRVPNRYSNVGVG